MEDRAKHLCPITHGILSRVEAIRSHADLRPTQETAMFSRLTPGTHLRPHCGPTNTHLTCHLGLKVPAGCEIRCGTEKRIWKEGKCLIFDDSFEHEVWHQGDSVRLVLLIRFWHPEFVPSLRAGIVRDEVRQRRAKAWVLL